MKVFQVFSSSFFKTILKDMVHFIDIIEEEVMKNVVKFLLIDYCY